MTLDQNGLRILLLTAIFVYSNWRLKDQIFEFKNRMPKFINSNI